MKKVSLLALALSTTMATFASAQATVPVVATVPMVTTPNAAPCAVPCPCPKAFQGFSFGGNIGYGVGKSGLKNTTTDTTIVGGSRETRTSHPNSTLQGVDGGLMAGYLHRFGNWGLGVDFFANWTGSKAKHTRTDSITAAGVTTTATDEYSVKLKNSLDLRGVFSYVINNLVMPKVMLGWENAQYHVHANDPTVFPASTRKSHTKRLNGFLWGTGVDFLVAKNVVCGLEYTGVMMNSMSVDHAYSSATHRYTSSTKIKPQYNKFAFVVKFVY